MSIHVILGKTGHGKTTFATMMALQCLARYKQKAARRGVEPRKVAANYHIFDPKNPGVPHPEIFYIPDFAGMKKLGNTTYFMDEASLWFGRRSWSKTSDQDLHAFRQHRHDGNNIYMIAHGFNDIESKIIDTLATDLWIVRRWLGPDRDDDPTMLEDAFGWRAVAVRFNAEDYALKTIRRPIGWRFFEISRHHKLFDSFSVIGDREGEGIREGRNAAAQARNVPQPQRPAWTKEQYLRGVKDHGNGVGHTRYFAPIEDDLERIFVNGWQPHVVDDPVEVPSHQKENDDRTLVIPGNSPVRFRLGGRRRRTGDSAV